MDATVRVARPDDAGAIADVYAPVVEDSHVTFETTPPSEAEMADRIRETLERYPWLVCEHEGEVVGYAYASTHNDREAYRWGADVSAYVAEQWRRRGVARGLYESLFELLRRQGRYVAYAVIALPNPPSVALHEDLGFEPVGVYEAAGFRDGAWRDVGHWELVLQPRETPPPEPTPFGEFRESGDVESALRAGESTVRR